MTMKVLIAGASGAIGMPLVRRLRASSHEVVALHRDPEAHHRLAAAGTTPVRADVLDQCALLRALDGDRVDAVISQLTSLKKVPMRHRDMAMTDRLRDEGTRNLRAAAEQAGALRFLTQSFVFGYGYGNWHRRVLTESDRFAPPGKGRFEAHLAAMRANEEQALRAETMAGIALRYGLLYGPGPAGDALVEALRRRRLPAVRHPDVEPWLYIDDAVSATLAALEHGEGGTAYNIVDDEPVSMSRLAIALADAIGLPKPPTVPAWMLAAAPYAKAVALGGLRISNAKAKRELSWMPDVPTYQEGVRRMADHYREDFARPA